MTAADPYAISIKNAFQGAPIPFVFNFWDTPPDPGAQPPVVGVPHDISGWTFMFTMKKDYADLDAAALYKLDWSIAIGDGTGGSTSCTVPVAVTSGLEAKFFYHWDLRAILTPITPAPPHELLAGTVYLNPAVGLRLFPGG